MKVFQYNLNSNGEGPAGRLPAGSLTGYFSDPNYYGVAMIADLTGLEEFNPVEITPLQFNQLFTPVPTEEVPDPVPALVAFQDVVREYYAEKLKAIVTPYTLQERETWFIQLNEAQKYVANPSIPASEIPMITAIATTRSLPVSEIADAIIVKNNEYSVAVGNTLGEQQALVQTLWTK